MNCSPTRLFWPWNFLGRNIGVGCHFLLQEIILVRPGIELTYPTLAGRFSTTEPSGKPQFWYAIKQTLWRRQWQPTPVLLPGKSHGRRSLVGCSPWGRYELDRTEQLHFHFSLSHIGEGNGNPLQCSCLENPRDGGAWWAAVYGVTQSRTWLKWLSSSSHTLWRAVSNVLHIFRKYVFSWITPFQHPVPATACCIILNIECHPVFDLRTHTSSKH